MPRPATGQVLEKPTKGRGVAFAVRFRAHGERQYVTLGYEDDGWTRAKADEELGYILAQVRRGVWRPPETIANEPVETQDSTFHEFASGWLARHNLEWAPRTQDDYRWRLTDHLLPYFSRHRLSQITVREVDAYKARALAESERRRAAITAGRPLRGERGNTLRPFGADTVNKTLKLLAQILDEAIEYDDEIVEAPNPAKGRRRRVHVKPEDKPRPVHLDSVDHIVAVLDAARQLDADPKSRTERYPLVATLIFAGPRASEAGDFLVRSLDLARGHLEVGRAKTDAGYRTIDVLPVLHDILAADKAKRPRARLDDPLFPTKTGGRRDKDNIADRVLKPVLARADELLAERGQHPLPRGITPHKLRHGFASILVACGRDPVYVKDQLGHTDPTFTMRVYTHAMRFSESERARLRALVDGGEWAPGAATVPKSPEIPAVPAASARGGTAAVAT